MRRLKILLICCVATSALGQWSPQNSNTNSSLHGLSIVNANVVWASGTGGTFLRTTDGGRTWQPGTVAGAEKLDFRGVYAIDARTAYLMSIGNGNDSRIYKTTDAGKSWSLQYTEQNPKAFLDCMAFWDATHGIVVGDPVDGKPELLTTSDGGAHWTPLRSNLPAETSGEGSPASGSCLATYAAGKGSKKTWHAWFVTENASRVFHSADAGKTWAVSPTPLVTGQNQGVFSIAIVDANRLVIVGGDYDHPQVVNANSAYSDDGGKTWTESSHRPAGYRWGVAVVPNTPGPSLFAVGPTGMDYSTDGGRNWRQMNGEKTNTIGFADAHRGWAVGAKGLILTFEGSLPGNAFRDCPECPEMVVIPAGHFVMGSSDGEKAWAASHGGSKGSVSDEAPQHEVTLASFALGKYDVTRGEYAAFVHATGRASGSDCGHGLGKWDKDPKLSWQNPGFTQTDRDPVVCVTWKDAQAYVQWLSSKTGHAYRLPTESEWEYAARAGTSTRFWWGDDDSQAPTYAWFRDNSGGEKVTGANPLKLYEFPGATHPVGRKPANAFGLYDIVGNVWQWTEDCYDNDYAGAPSDGHAKATPSKDPKANDSQGKCLRVDRGGSWMFPAWLLRPATRERNPEDFGDPIMGFRVARTLP